MKEEKYPKELRYSDNHLWVRVIEDGNAAVVGISLYVNEQLGNMVYVDLPEVDSEVDVNEEVGLLESSENTHGLYSPLSGEIIAINYELENNPSLINSDPYGDGWIYKIKLIDIDEIDDLMSDEEYQDFVKTTID